MKYHLLALTFLLSIAYLGYIPGQEHFIWLLMGYAVAFSAVIVLFLKPRQFSPAQIRYWLVVAILARVILLPAFPMLSDDVYRFLWDGLLVIHGESPFVYLPSEIIGSEGFGYLTQGLYDQLNSPDYYSVYPPLSEAIFALGAWLSPKSVLGFSIVLKVILLLGECLSIYFGLKILQLINRRPERIFLYALNPLIVIELVGNLHFEALVVAGMSCAIYYLIKAQMAKSALAWVFAIGIKLIPLLLLPLLWRNVKNRKLLAVFYAIVGVLSLILLLPVILALGTGNFLSSIDLYFRNFEFNASIYYLVRQIGFAIEGFNLIAIIGPLLAGITFLIAILNSFWAKKELDWYRFLSLLLWVYCIYLFLSTTVHPWYLSLPIFLSIFTRFRFPILWSLLIVLSYSHYYHGNSEENYFFIWVEYSLVMIAFIWEWLRDCSIFPWLMDEDPDK